MSWAAIVLNRGWRQDGHPHLRDRQGFCTSCGARNGEGHYKLLTVVPACTCKVDPYTCPQGQALVSAIHERRGNQ